MILAAGCSNEDRAKLPISLPFATPTPFELYNHCGLSQSLVFFDGSYWEPAEYLKWNDLVDPIDRGTMQLVEDDLALYTSDRATEILFRRLSSRPDVETCA